MNLLRKTDRASAQRDIERFQKYSRYVASDARRERMLQAIDSAQSSLDQNDVRQARKSISDASHEYVMARYEGNVIFYATATAGIVSFINLAIFSVIAGTALMYPPIRGNSVLLPIVLAFATGGIGGATAVISNAVGIRLETQAITARRTWYVAKPLLGAIIGVFTYLAVLSALTFFSSSTEVDNIAGVMLVGFLGGYLESFSTKMLNNLADGLTRG